MATNDESERGCAISKDSLSLYGRKGNVRPNDGCVHVGSRNSPPSQLGCVVHGHDLGKQQMRMPTPSYPSLPFTTPHVTATCTSSRKDYPFQIAIHHISAAVYDVIRTCSRQRAVVGIQIERRQRAAPVTTIQLNYTSPVPRRHALYLRLGVAPSRNVHPAACSWWHTYG